MEEIVVTTYKSKINLYYQVHIVFNDYIAFEKISKFRHRRNLI